MYMCRERIILLLSDDENNYWRKPSIYIFIHFNKHQKQWEKKNSLSLFFERLTWSGHLTAAKSGDSGLLEMLHEAYDLYQVEVVNQGKIYQRYADDFVYSCKW